MLNVTEMKIVAQETENSLRQFQTGETDPKLVVKATGALADYKKLLISRYGETFIVDEPAIVDEIVRRNRERKIAIDRIKAKRERDALAAERAISGW